MKTKLLEIFCPTHGKYFPNTKKYVNFCPWRCGGGYERVCSVCEKNVTVDEQWRLECSNCKKKNYE